MKKIQLFIILISQLSFSQFTGFFDAKEFSKEISLFKAKTFLINDVLKITDKSTKFEAIPLAAASSGELTTLLYKCGSQNSEGIILGFYGNYWNKTGVTYQGYAFKNLSKEKANEFLNKIANEIEENKKFLDANTDENNIAFVYEDLTVLIWTSTTSFKIRLFWNGFDSTWEDTSYGRTKRRFERKTK